MDEPLAFRFPLSGAEGLERGLRQQHEQMQNQQHQYGCQQHWNLSPDQAQAKPYAREHAKPGIPFSSS